MAAESSRPLLLPQNRRLRHLKGIWLRNLTTARPRGHTIDDATLNKTPEKLEALREAAREPALQQSASSDNLNAGIRPRGTRRRSTVWAGATPGYRQKKLEDVIDGGMVDTFFSLHCEGEREPVYISELLEKAMNPNFSFFDLDSYSPTITRQCQLTIKFWTKRHSYSLLLEQFVDLRQLHFIGSLQNRSLPPNSLVFHLVDGIYLLNLPTGKLPPAKQFQPLPTSSYSALMRLSSLDDSIQDALATREQIAAQINKILEERPADEAPQAQETAKLAAKYVKIENQRLDAAIKRRDEIKSSIEAKREGIKRAQAAQDRVRTRMEEAIIEIPKLEAEHQQVKDDLRGQRRRICEELMAVFPIESTSKSLVFTICGLELPNTNFDDADQDLVAGALGHVALVVFMLSAYLYTPLPYPISWFGSRSIIKDEISQLADSNRVFPLFGKGSVPFRFEYAVFLLNKDIECLAERQGLKVPDIRQTLPNLKYLLYIASAGTEELPARKAGGIRGLLGSRRGTPIVSRRPSEEGGSGRAASRDAGRAPIRSGLAGPENGNGYGVVMGGMSLHLPFEEDQGVSLRTKGLREGRP